MLQKSGFELHTGKDFPKERALTETLKSVVLPSLMFFQKKRDHLGSLSKLDKVPELWKSVQWRLRAPGVVCASVGETRHSKLQKR